jgi:hypothetical protein
MYLVYQTTCKINNKIYVGVHESDSLDDGYLGSGTYFNRAVKKYGKENFERIILRHCESREEMLLLEKEIVNEEFVSRKDTYNVTIGGEGSWWHVNKNLTTEQRQLGGRNGGFANRDKLSEDSLKRMQEGSLRGGKMAASRLHKRIKDGILENHWIGRHHSDDARIKISEGKSKALTGTVWIYNLELKISKQIKPELIEDHLKEGWLRGRKRKKFWSQYPQLA